MFKDVPEDIILLTQRCRLRPVHLDDIPHVFEATRYPGFNDGMHWDPPESEEDLLIPHQRSIDAWKARQGYTFTAESLDAGQFIGRIVIRQQQLGIGNIGYWIHPREQGKGYGKEITNRIVQFGFETLELDRIEASHAVWNMASRAILEHVGMTFVARIPEGMMKNGEWIAEDKLAIDRKAWLELQQRKDLEQ